MSATGQGGVSVIGALANGLPAPVSIPAGQTLTFTHNVGRRAFQVLVTDGTSGALIPQTVCAVAQPSVNAVTVQNLDEGAHSVFVSVRWENLTEERDPVEATDSRVVIAA